MQHLSSLTEMTPSSPGIKTALFTSSAQPSSLAISCGLRTFPLDPPDCEDGLISAAILASNFLKSCDYNLIRLVTLNSEKFRELTVNRAIC